MNGKSLEDAYLVEARRSLSLGVTAKSSPTSSILEGRNDKLRRI
jgi:hypothetical protein